MQAGGNLIEWHACELFPEAWIDLVVVLRSGTAEIYDRLTARGYKDSKLQENIDAEVMEVILQEAREGFAGDKVLEMQSNNMEDVDLNTLKIMSWLNAWSPSND